MNDGYSNDDYGRTAAKFVEALRKIGATQDANEIQIFATTGEDFIAIEVGIYYMVKHGLPVDEETAQFVLDVCEEDKAGDNQIAAARKALVDAKKRAKA